MQCKRQKEYTISDINDVNVKAGWPRSY